jgi:hypothetical protein
VRLIPVRRVLVLLAVAGLIVAGRMLPGGATEKTLARFVLHPNPQFVNCLAQFPVDPARPPTARVSLVKQDLNDKLRIQISNVRPGLTFKLFTVQRSPFLATGAADPKFPKTFGVAWYQSDVKSDKNGRGTAEIHTILVDEPFAFDGDANVKLAPINTFNVGIWFSSPKDAQPCSVTPVAITPFSETHDAGPMAMISAPVAPANLGPLCLHPVAATATKAAFCDIPKD